MYAVEPLGLFLCSCLWGCYLFFLNDRIVSLDDGTYQAAKVRDRIRDLIGE